MADPTWRNRISVLRQGFLDAGMPVFSAHHNERWGAGWLPAEACVPNDFRAMETCDVVCAYLGTPASGGVCIELGWASAMRKPVWRGENGRESVDRDRAMRALSRYGLAASRDQPFETLSGGHQARFQVLLLEISGATLLLLDEPTA